MQSAEAIQNQFRKRNQQSGSISTCASSGDLSGFQGTKGIPSPKAQDASPEAIVDFHILERRTFMDCIDPVGIAKALYNFDWSRVVWKNVLIQLVVHSLAFFGFRKAFAGQVSYSTMIFHIVVHVIAALGITAGYHRLWSHRGYKCHRVVHYCLMVMGTLATQNSIYEWARDHRTHHKHSETEADPHNAGNGLFFAHIGWLMLRKREEVKEKGKQCTLTDLEKDSMVMWQHRNYLPFVLFCTVVLPTIIPMYFFGESFWAAYCLAFSRILFTLHATWCVNSLAHWWGDTPYDATMFPVENYFVAWLTVGEGWHNYHHAFPNDYRCSDRNDPLWFRTFFNPTQMLIDTWAKLGLAWGRVTAPRQLVASRISSHGPDAIRARLESAMY